MHCYTHQDQTAIGICKVCGKGLCINCAADLGESLACANQHETTAAEITAMVRQSIKVQSTAKKSIVMGPLFFTFLGACFVALGFMDNSRAATIFMLMGGAFVVFGLTLFLVNRRAFSSVSRHDAKSGGRAD